MDHVHLEARPTQACSLSSDEASRGICARIWTAEVIYNSQLPPPPFLSILMPSESLQTPDTTLGDCGSSLLFLILADTQSPVFTSLLQHPWESPTRWTHPRDKAGIFLFLLLPVVFSISSLCLTDLLALIKSNFWRTCLSPFRLLEQKYHRLDGGS